MKKSRKNRATAKKPGRRIVPVLLLLKEDRRWSGLILANLQRQEGVTKKEKTENPLKMRKTRRGAKKKT